MQEKAEERDKEKWMRERKQTSVISEQSTTTVLSITDKAGSGCTVIVEQVSTMTQGDESSMQQKTDDELGNTQIV